LPVELIDRTPTPSTVLRDNVVMQRNGNSWYRENSRMDNNPFFALDGYLVALGVGLLIGSERERNKGEGAQRGAAGVRTFAITALLGAVAGSLEVPLLSAVGGIAVIVLAVASYRMGRQLDPGITTELALCLTYFIGILAIPKPLLAGALGVLLALLLVSRSWLHDFVLHKLTAQENLDAILLAAAALIILPLLPNRAVDPYQAINPQLIGRLTIIVMLLNAFGYVMLRTLGAQRGLLVAGLFGGFISSVATIATMGERARSEPHARAAAVAGATLSSVSTVIQLALILTATYPHLLARLTIALTAMCVFAALYASLFVKRVLRSTVPIATPKGRAFQPRQAIQFALMITTVLFLSEWLTRQFGTRGALVGIIAGGFADAHSASATAAAMTQRGTLDFPTATLGILAAITANTCTKAATAVIAGGIDFAKQLVPGLVLMLLGLYAGAWLAGV